MKTLSVLVVILSLMLVISCGQKVDQSSYTMENFNEQAQNIQDNTAMIVLCKDFLHNATDVELLRNAQNVLIDLDKDEALTFSKKLADDNQDSPVYQYLYGRVIKDPIEQIKIGREVIKIDAKFAYGYRLVTANYLQSLFEGDPESEVYQQLATMVSKDDAAFAEFATLDTVGTFSIKTLIAYQIYLKDFETVRTTMEANSDKFTKWPGGLDYAGFLVGIGEYDAALQKVTEVINARHEAGKIPDEDVQDYLEYYYTSSLRDYRVYDEIIAHHTSQKGYAKDNDRLYSVACAYGLKGDIKNAALTLDKAIKQGWDKVNHTQTDSDLDLLHDDSRWDGYIARIQKNWDAGKPERKKETLSTKISIDAPAFELEDAEGNKVSLESLKGKIVVLDFWATWCGPCRTAMPMIDKFTETAPDDVRVFSVNIWEKGGSKQIEFMAENEYDMTLLFGNDELTKAYGVNSIPTLIVIDKEGIIRYKEAGAGEQLAENLIWWTGDLQ